MAFDVNNFIIDHVIRGAMLSQTDNSVLWSVNQITDPSLSITSETAEAVDALGTPIATFNRAKSAEFSASNSIIDLGLLAGQQGRDKEIASAGATIKTPAFETITVPTPNTTAVQLAHTPIDNPTVIYKLNGDDTLGEKVEYAGEAAADKFSITTNSLTFHTNAVPGDEYFIVYEYEAEEAVAVTGDSVNFPKAGKFLMEVLGTDVCDQTKLIHAYIEFPNAKLSTDFDLSFTTDATHPFTITAQQAYCDREKILFRIIVPNEE